MVFPSRGMQAPSEALPPVAPSEALPPVAQKYLRVRMPGAPTVTSDLGLKPNGGLGAVGSSCSPSKVQ